MPSFGSDFERINESQYGKTVGASLLEQYRMAPDIGMLVSDCFYGGQLKSERRCLPRTTRSCRITCGTRSLG